MLEVFVYPICMRPERLGRLAVSSPSTGLLAAVPLRSAEQASGAFFAPKS